MFLRNLFYSFPSAVIHCICFDYFCNLLFSLGSFLILCEYNSNTLAWIPFLIWWKRSICFHSILVYKMQYNISLVFILKSSDVYMHCWNHCRMLNKLFVTSVSSLEWQRKMTIGPWRVNVMAWRIAKETCEIIFRNADFSPVPCHTLLPCKISLHILSSVYMWICKKHRADSFCSGRRY